MPRWIVLVGLTVVLGSHGYQRPHRPEPRVLVCEIAARWHLAVPGCYHIA